MSDHVYGVATPRDPSPNNLLNELDFIVLDVEIAAQAKLAAPNFPKVFDDLEAELVCIELLIKELFDMRAKKMAAAGKGVLHAE